MHSLPDPSEASGHHIPAIHELHDLARAYLLQGDPGLCVGEFRVWLQERGVHDRLVTEIAAERESSRERALEDVADILDFEYERRERAKAEDRVAEMTDAELLMLIRVVVIELARRRIFLAEALEVALPIDARSRLSPGDASCDPDEERRLWLDRVQVLASERHLSVKDRQRLWDEHVGRGTDPKRTDPAALQALSKAIEAIPKP
jgi:hypothetical protein